MLTEKDIENIEEYIRGNLDDERVSDLQIKIDSNPLYKKKYEELQVLSEAIHKYEEHKHIFDKIKAKKNILDTSKDHTFKPNYQSDQYRSYPSSVSNSEPSSRYSMDSSGKVVNFNKYFNTRNISIAASIAILIGIIFYPKSSSDNTQEYGAPEKVITDSLELDSLKQKEDSLSNLRQYFK